MRGPWLAAPCHSGPVVAPCRGGVCPRYQGADIPRRIGGEYAGLADPSRRFCERDLAGIGRILCEPLTYRIMKPQPTIPSPYRHPLPLIRAAGKPRTSLATLALQVAACVLFGVAFVAAAVALHHITR